MPHELGGQLLPRRKGKHPTAMDPVKVTGSVL